MVSPDSPRGNKYVKLFLFPPTHTRRDKSGSLIREHFLANLYGYIKFIFGFIEWLYLFKYNKFKVALKENINPDDHKFKKNVFFSQ